MMPEQPVTFPRGERPLSQHEIAGRFRALKEQRDSALDQIVALAGEIAMLQSEIIELRRQLGAAHAKVA